MRLGNGLDKFGKKINSGPFNSTKESIRIVSNIHSL